MTENRNEFRKPDAHQGKNGEKNKSVNRSRRDNFNGTGFSAKISADDIDLMYGHGEGSEGGSEKGRGGSDVDQINLDFTEASKRRKINFGNNGNNVNKIQNIASGSKNVVLTCYGGNNLNAYNYDNVNNTTDVNSTYSLNNSRSFMHENGKNQSYQPNNTTFSNGSSINKNSNANVNTINQNNRSKNYLYQNLNTNNNNNNIININNSMNNTNINSTNDNDRNSKFASINSNSTIDMSFVNGYNAVINNVNKNSINSIENGRGNNGLILTVNNNLNNNPNSNGISNHVFGINNYNMNENNGNVNNGNGVTDFTLYNNNNNNHQIINGPNNLFTPHGIHTQTVLSHQNNTQISPHNISRELTESDIYYVVAEQKKIHLKQLNSIKSGIPAFDKNKILVRTYVH